MLSTSKVWWPIFIGDSIWGTIEKVWAEALQTLIRKSQDSISTPDYSSRYVTCELLHLQCLEALDMSCDTKVPPEACCHTRLPPILPDILYTSLAPVDLPQIYSACRIPLICTRLLYGFPAFSHLACIYFLLEQYQSAPSICSLLCSSVDIFISWHWYNQVHKAANSAAGIWLYTQKYGWKHKVPTIGLLFFLLIFLIIPFIYLLI